MPCMSCTRHINAPIERVFQVFTDLRAATGRVKSIKRLEVLTEGPIGKGTKFRETRIMFGREATETMEITDFRPPHGYAVGASSCGVEFRFRPSGNATEVEMEVTTRPLTLMARLMAPLGKLMMGQMKKACNADLSDLQQACEAGA